MPEDGGRRDDPIEVRIRYAADLDIGHDFAVLDGCGAAEAVELVGGFGALDAFEFERCQHESRQQWHQAV